MLKKMDFLKGLSLAFVLIGALNWGLVGIFRFDLVMAIFGAFPIVCRIIYSLVGIGALYLIATYFVEKK